MLPHKSAKRANPFSVLIEAANRVSLLPLRDEDEDEDVRTTKKPRLQEPLSASPDEAATKIVSHDTVLALPPADVDADLNPVTHTQPNAGATRATARWTPEEDAKLTDAVTNTCKKKWGKEYKIDWAAVAALVPGRAGKHCRSRWHDVLDPNIDRANGRTGTWTEDEDNKLKGAVQTHGGKNWNKIAAFVPRRTRAQCNARWHNALDPNIDLANRRTGKWTDEEDTKLKDALQAHGSKDWVAIAALVPGRTKNQCYDRWKKYIDPSRSTVRGKEHGTA
jgi:hypothetical protein